MVKNVALLNVLHFQRPFALLEDSEYPPNALKLYTLIEMMAKDCYPEKAKCIFVKLLTQSACMHSEHFLNFLRKITKCSIFPFSGSLESFNILPQVCLWGNN